MTKRLLFTAFLVIASWSLPLSAFAAIRTFVSSTGSDSGVCSRAAPCRSFSYAVTQTSSGGELDVLDTAGYGPVTITQAITINNPDGNLASIAVPAGQAGITINAPAGAAVTIRGVTVDGGGAGANGIVFNTGGSLTIDRCIVQNFVGMGPSGNGILLVPTSAGPVIRVVDTLVANNTTSGFYLSLRNSGYTGTVAMKIDRLAAHNNPLGVWLYNVSQAFAYAAISNTIVSKFTNGFDITGATVDLDTVEANFGTKGVLTASSQVYINRSMLRQNGLDAHNTSGFMYSGGNNFMQYTLGTITPFGLK